MAHLPSWFKTYLPAIVASAAGLTFSFFISIIGAVGLVVIWMLLVLGVAVVYALVWRGEALSAKKEKNDLIARAGKSDAAKEDRMHEEQRVEDLERQLKGVEAESTAWKRATEEQKEGRLKAERELAEARKKAPPPKPRLDITGEIILATDLVVGPDQFADAVSKRLRRNTVIEVLAESDGWFSIFVFDSENMRRFRESRRNTESLAGKKNVRTYRERVVIPRGDDWYFVIEPVEGQDSAEARLTVALVSEE